MSNLADQTTSNGRPVETPQKNDRYFFGSLDSFGKNQTKLNEVSWGYDQPEGIVLASLDSAINWVRKNSIWPMTFGLACCAIEMMSMGGSRYDIAPFRCRGLPSIPRQSDPDDHRAGRGLAEDGRQSSGVSTSRCRSRSGLSRWVPVQPPEGSSIITLCYRE